LIYVFDTNSLSNVLNHYYRDRFPSFWQKLNEAIRDGWLLSVRECKGELKEKFRDDEVERLLENNADFFADPTAQELAFITRVYSVPHFRQNLEQKKLLKGGYFADPFIIARASALAGVVVTEEQFRANAAKIPNICERFDILCVSLEGFLLREDWTF